MDIEVVIGPTLAFDVPEERDRRSPPVRRFLEKLNTYTTHLNPAYTRARRQGRWVSKEQERIKLLEIREGKIHLPRGALPLLQQAAREARGVYLSWSPEVVSNGVGPRAIPSGLQLRPEYQQAIVDAILNRRQGVVVLPCGGGKTVSGTAAAWATGEATLILVHTEDLLRQWESAISFITGQIPRLIGAGRQGPGRMRPGEFVVAMVQTLEARLEEYQALLSTAGFLLVDECHHAPAATVKTVINRCGARFRVGLSATPERADGFGFLLHALIGPTIFQLPNGAQDLISWGYLLRPLVIPVITGFSPPRSAYVWNFTCPECEKAESKKRNNRAAQSIAATAEKRLFLRGQLPCKRKKRQSVQCKYVFTGKEPVTLGDTISAQVITAAMNAPRRIEIMRDLSVVGVHEGRRVLNLLARKDAVERLADALQGYTFQARGLTSDTAREERAGIMEAFKSGEVPCIAATQLADEGLDVPELDLLISGSGGRFDGVAQQRAGRAARPKGAEVPVVVDLVDAYPSALSQWYARGRAYVGAYGEHCLPTPRPVDPQVAQEALAMLGAGHSREVVEMFLQTEAKRKTVKRA